MARLNLYPATDHFILRREKPDGTKEAMSLTPLEILTLAEMVTTLRQQAFAMMYPLENTASAQAVMTLEIRNFQLRPEIQEAKLILNVQLGNTDSRTVAYALSRSLADRLAREIAVLLPSMRKNPPTQQ
jgi:hypothetical protein